MSEMKCRRCGANESRIHGFCSIACEDKFYLEEEIAELTARIAVLEKGIAELKPYRDGYDPNINPPKVYQLVLAQCKTFGWRTVEFKINDNGKIYFTECISGVGFGVADCIRWYPLPPDHVDGER
ncbi:MAG: hypothetical protein AAGU15_08910 [Anaerolineaceae bacterium]